MRRLLTVVSALSVLASQPGFAAQRCASTADQSMFEVQALRSQLMVLATGCRYDEKYNAFIKRYQSDLQANERAVSAYFSRHYGRSGQTEHDRFVTDLANAVSRQGTTTFGGDFCPRDGLVFAEVLALPANSDLPDFAAGKNIVPASIDICSSSGGAKSATPASSKKKK